MTWVGNTYNWPSSGQITAGQDVWVNTESYPMGAGKSGAIVYKAGTNAWVSANLGKAGVQGQNDWWNIKLGTFPANTVVQYAVAVVDGNGVYKWDSRGGQNYSFTVNGGVALQWVGTV